jgi:quinol-cytochrome oxidoreductase complex cytochrome b subunit
MIMSEKNSYEVGFSSDALRQPRRIVFITRKTSAKVKEEIGPQLMSFPHVILRESIAFQVLTIVLVALALFWDAPLEQLANPLLTPNPAKAPWYFLGLQELLHYFPPVLAGVLIPTLVVLALVVIPYFDVNIEGEPLWAHRSRRRLQIYAGAFAVLFVLLAIYDAWTVLVPTALVGALGLIPYFNPTGNSRFQKFLGSRPLPWWVMTWFIAVALTLTAVGTFFRGPGWSWVWPWS